jgi:hypothetical protein
MTVQHCVQVWVCERRVCAFLATMSISSQNVTYDSYTPSGSSSSNRTSINGALYHKSSEESLQSYQGSISNSSAHTSTAANDKDPFELSGQDPVFHHSSDSSSGRDPSISDHKSFHSLLKTPFAFRNQSVSTVCTTREPESNRSSTAASTPSQKSRSLSILSLENEAESSLPSTSRSSPTIPILITDPSPSPSPSPTYLRVFKSVDGGLVPTVCAVFSCSPQPPPDSSKQPALSHSKNPHSSDGPRIAYYPFHLPTSYRSKPFLPQPAQVAQPNLDESNGQQSVPKPPRSDTLVPTNTTKDRHYSVPPASVEAPARELPNSSIADLALKSQATVTANVTVERRVPQPPTIPQRRSVAATGSWITADDAVWRREKEDRANDADIVNRLQLICTDADPTRLYRNLVKVGQG